MNDRAATTTYTHKNVPITFHVLGAKFTAVANGTELSAPSLPAIKARIDAVLKTRFEPFKALCWWASEMHPITVLRVEKGHTGVLRFVTDTKRYLLGPSRYTPDTPENRAAILVYQNAFAHAEAEKARLDANVDRLRNAIPLTYPTDYGVTK